MFGIESFERVFKNILCNVLNVFLFEGAKNRFGDFKEDGACSGWPGNKQQSKKAESGEQRTIGLPEVQKQKRGVHPTKGGWQAQIHQVTLKPQTNEHSQEEYAGGWGQWVLEKHQQAKAGSYEKETKYQGKPTAPHGSGGLSGGGAGIHQFLQDKGPVNESNGLLEVGSHGFEVALGVGQLLTQGHGGDQDLDGEAIGGAVVAGRNIGGIWERGIETFEHVDVVVAIFEFFVMQDDMGEGVGTDLIEGAFAKGLRDVQGESVFGTFAKYGQGAFWQWGFIILNVGADQKKSGVDR